MERLHRTNSPGRDMILRLAIKKQKGTTAFKGYGTHIKVKGDPVTLYLGDWVIHPPPRVIPTTMSDHLVSYDITALQV